MFDHEELKQAILTEIKFSGFMNTRNEYLHMLYAQIKRIAT